MQSSNCLCLSVSKISLYGFQHNCARLMLISREVHRESALISHFSCNKCLVFPVPPPCESTSLIAAALWGLTCHPRWAWEVQELEFVTAGRPGLADETGCVMTGEEEEAGGFLLFLIACLWEPGSGAFSEDFQRGTPSACSAAASHSSLSAAAAAPQLCCSSHFLQS